MGSGDAQALARLTRLNTDELIRSFRLRAPRLFTPLYRRVLDVPSGALARRVLDFDRGVREDGLQAASRRFAGGFVRTLEVRGAERIPPAGPVLLCSNHPGQTDSIALFSAIPRRDLRAIAAERDLLRALPNLRGLLLEVPEEAEKRSRVVLEAARHLRAGGALLTFPAGAIEPDPAIHADAVLSIDSWSDSVASLARVVSGLVVLPVIVSGVLSPAALRSLLPRLYRGRKQREWVAATIQVMLRRYRNVTVRVSIGEPLRFGSRESRSEIMEAVRREGLRLVLEARAAAQRGRRHGSVG